jgi:predicted metal-binding membrane protein
VARRGGVTETRATAATLARAHRIILIASTAAVTLAAWLWLTQGPAHHMHSAVLLPHCNGQAGWSRFLAAVVMWQAMNIAMMTPTTLNWLFAYTALTARSEPRRTVPSVIAFVTGYFFVWLGYSVAGAAIQIAFERTGLLDHEGRFPSIVPALILIAAGLVYFTPLSRACLKHCRNPLTYFLERWDRGPRSGFRFGAAHGVYCVGCCWALMLTGFAMGLMNMVWMGVLTVIVCLEKLAPRGDRIAGIAAVLLIVWGAGLLLGIPAG